MGLSNRLAYGHAPSATVNGTKTLAPNSAPTLASLLLFASIDGACFQGNVVTCDNDQSVWFYDAASTLTADNIFVGNPSDSPTAGRWIRMAGEVDIRIPIAFGTADATVLATVPAGMRLKLVDAYWEVTTGWTGGSSSAIGISSGTNAACNTKGDLLGGATGDVAATLVSSGPSNFVLGTGGAKLMGTNTQIRACHLVAADTIRFDRITSAFTAGAGFVHIVAFMELQPTS